MFLERSNKILPLCLLSLVALWGCFKKDSFTSASYSDNKTFKSRGYESAEPILPYNNLMHSEEQEISTEAFYENQVDYGYYKLKTDEEYLKWLDSERKKRLQAGRLNGFKKETIPGKNEYYIQKTYAMGKAGKTLNERQLIEVSQVVDKSRKKYTQIKVVEKPDPINNYQIKNNIIYEESLEKVDSDEYYKSF